MNIVAERPPSGGGPVPAAGWIKALKVAANGIWGEAGQAAQAERRPAERAAGTVAWTDRARALIAARENRYLSPVLVCGANDGRIIRLNGAGLVHTPNLHLTALAAEEETAMPPDPRKSEAPDAAALLARLAQMLKLPPDARAEDIIAAFEKAMATPDPKRFAPAEAVQDMVRRRQHKTGHPR